MQAQPLTHKEVCGAITLALFVGNEIEGGLANLTRAANPHRPGAALAAMPAVAALLRADANLLQVEVGGNRRRALDTSCTQ